MTGPADEPDLALGLRASDPAALAALYDRLGETAFALARSIVGDARDAEEVVSDAFLRVWSRANDYDPGRGSLRAWVMAIVRNRALDRLRARRRREGLHERAERTVAFSLSPSEPAVSSESLGRLDATRRLAGALAAFPDERRRTLGLAYFEGLTQSEIATVEGVPLGTVKTRMRAGMQELRDALGAAAGEGAA